MADTGLLVTHALSDAGRVSERAYRSLLVGNIGINEGMLVENAIAQTLVAKGDRLFFYSQSGLEQGQERMEFDLLVARPFQDAALKPRVFPIEVTSPQRYGTTSLDRFKAKSGNRVGDEYVPHPKPLSAAGGRRYIPLYMVHLL